MIKKLANTLVFTPLGQLWSPTRPLTTTKALFKCVGRGVTIGIGLGIIGVALKALATTAAGPALGTVSFLATVGAFPPALLITSAIIATIASGMIVSYLIETYAV